RVRQPEPSAGMPERSLLTRGGGHVAGAAGPGAHMRRFGMTTKRRLGICAAVALLLVVGAAPASAAGKTKCDLSFSLSGWAALYEHSTGSGTITCDNGQKARVAISLKAGGLTAGKFRIDGHGEFSEVSNIRELYGNYVAADANAGAVKA